MYKGEYELNDNIEVINERPVEIIGELKLINLNLNERYRYRWSICIKR